jgi:phosphoribosylformylglycinamidine synthase
MSIVIVFMGVSWTRIESIAVPTYRVLVTPASPSTEADTVHTRLYFLDGSALTREHVTSIAATMLADPVTERYAIDPPTPAGHFVDVTYLPGVTDSVAESLLDAAHAAGIAQLGRAASGERVTFNVLPKGDLRAYAESQLANTVVQRVSVDAVIAPPFVVATDANVGVVERITIAGLDDDALLALSKTRRLSLDLAEMRAIRAYYEGIGREATDIELEMLAQTWSEHCVHKTFKARIDVEAGAMRRSINGLLKTYIRAATDELAKPWVKSAFVDNAGVIAFNDAFDLAFKVETHNHPSALEPFGGANTGVGGVIRDVLGVSARPIANTDVLCFGPLDRTDVPAGVLPPQRVYDGVIRGIEDYGNKMGIPTVNGAILHHPGYTSNPLVFCGCLGIVPADLFATPRPERNVGRGVQPGDLIVAIGGRTGRDGLRGATFSSMEIDVDTGAIAGSSVQIGHPIHEKQVQEAVLLARDADLYHAITDCGAGGFSSAVGEMAGSMGADVQLKHALLKYPGLQPWEIWLSEAQERIVVAVPPDNWPALKAICDSQDIDAFSLGTFEQTGMVTLRYGDDVVGELATHFLHDGIPQKQLHLRAGAETSRYAVVAVPRDAAGAAALLRALLAHPNIRSKERVVRTYDHEVKGGTAVKPFVGVANHGPSDAAVLVPDPTPDLDGKLRGVAVSNGLCPQYTEIDAYQMAWAAIDEAARNAVAVGADPDRIAILDNFCWGNPNLPDRLASLEAAARGCHDAALAYEMPFISGKDSLNNEYADADGARHAIPGTLLISAVGIVPDVARTVTMDFKAVGDLIYMLGDTRAELGGSHALPAADSPMPAPVPGALRRMRKLHAAMRAGHVTACHDCSEGGAAVALAEMCIAGRIGATVDLRKLPKDGAVDDFNALFSESSARFLVTVKPEHAPAFERGMTGLPCARIGLVGGDALQIVGQGGASVADERVETLEIAWRGERAPDAAHAAVADRRAPGLRLGKRVLILHANGSNRDHDAAHAIELAGGTPEIVHVNQVLSGAKRLSDFHMLLVPGGFSYGDDLGAGVLWSLALKQRLGPDLDAFARAGKPVLGICNGFQTLVKAGLLPGAASDVGDSARKVTLTYNARGHFECRWVWLVPNPRSPSVFTRGLDAPIYCPVAHGEGRLMTADEATLQALEVGQLVTLRYHADAYPANPNGSIAAIAGICNAQGNVMGLMPHPENHIFDWQHPRAHRGERGGDGLRLFVNGVKSA